MAGPGRRPGDRTVPQDIGDGTGSGGLTKPLDIGDGLVCASLGPRGELLSLGTLHQVHGFVEVTGMPLFDESWRGDPAAVRRYRSQMIDERHAFVTVKPLPADSAVRHETSPWMLPGQRAIRLRHHFERAAAGAGPTNIKVTVEGRLDRPPLAMITEVRPPTPTGASSAVRSEAGALVIESSELPAACRVAVEDTAAQEVAPWRVDGARAELIVPWDPRRADLEITIDCRLEVVSGESTQRPTPHGPTPKRATSNRDSSGRGLWIPDRSRPSLARMAITARRYVKGCTALELRPGERAILTDHRLLPLSWTRDAYYQALLLLQRDDPYTDGEDLEIVADHLRWLFLRCERPDGAWVRSHHGNGRRKDPVFQVDQQLFPLLELLDYQEVTGLLPEAGRPWAGVIAEAWAVVERATDPDLGLLATEENPADDETRHPYLVSSQILCWRVASRLAVLAPQLGLEAAPFSRTAADTRAAVDRHLTTEGPFGMQWAYAVDGRGGRELYQDANDLPTALAPLWGFCAPGDPVWQATMRFALSPHNPGYVDGRFAGLGSRHTPGVWPLGDIQAWVAMSLVDDRAGAEAALERLITVSMTDGMLPEAYDPATGQVTARHWFAWPGAILGALYLQAGA